MCFYSCICRERPWLKLRKRSCRISCSCWKPRLQNWKLRVLWPKGTLTLWPLLLNSSWSLLIRFWSCLCLCLSQNPPVCRGAGSAQQTSNRAAEETQGVSAAAAGTPRALWVPTTPSPYSRPRVQCHKPAGELNYNITLMFNIKIHNLLIFCIKAHCNVMQCGFTPSALSWQVFLFVYLVFFSFSKKNMFVWAHSYY